MTAQALMADKTMAELRTMASQYGITGLRRQALKKNELAKVIELGEYTGLKGDDLYRVFLNEKGETPPEVNTQPAPAAAPTGDLAAMIAVAVAPFVQGSVDADAVRDIVTNELMDYDEGLKAEIDSKIKDALKVKTVEVKRVDGTKKDIGVQHKQFETLLKLATIRTHAMLVGPAGSGKTSACHNVAEALDLEFYCFSVGMQTTKSDLLGYMDAHSQYVESIVYKTYKHGGVLLLDETDAGNANVLTILNAMLANGSMRFPNGEQVKRHEDFIFFGAANTYGRGADRMYVGRNQLDAATLDRFAVVNFDYDEALERAIAGNDEWTAKVQAWRNRAFDLKERAVISPRASIEGAKMLKAGFTEAEVEDMVVWKGIPTDIRNKIAAAY